MSHKPRHLKAAIILAIAAVMSTTVLAQPQAGDTAALMEVLQRCQTDLQATNSRVQGMSKSLNAAQAKVDTLEKHIATSEGRLANSIKMASEATTALRSDTETRIKDASNSTAAETHSIALYAGWGAAALLLLLITAYVLLHLRIAKGDASIDSIRQAQNKLSEESVALDTKLVELLNKQLTVEQELAKQRELSEKLTTTSAFTGAVPTDQSIAVEPPLKNTSARGETAPGADPDHTLTLKVADEITRIEMNLSRMDNSVKGHKQLTRAVERLKDNFAANGYEISSLLGKPYDEHMRLNADFVLDENLAPGTRTITAVSTPQVLYKGVMIQKATVTVTQNI